MDLLDRQFTDFFFTANPGCAHFEIGPYSIGGLLGVDTCQNFFTGSSGLVREFSENPRHVPGMFII